MIALPEVVDDVADAAVDEESPLLPSTSFNERSLEETLVVRPIQVRRLHIRPC